MLKLSTVYVQLPKKHWSSSLMTNICLSTVQDFNRWSSSPSLLSLPSASDTTAAANISVSGDVSNSSSFCSKKKNLGGNKWHLMLWFMGVKLNPLFNHAPCYEKNKWHMMLWFMGVKLNTLFNHAPCYEKNKWHRLGGFGLWWLK